MLSMVTPAPWLVEGSSELRSLRALAIGQKRMSKLTFFNSGKHAFLGKIDKSGGVCHYLIHKSDTFNTIEFRRADILPGVAPLAVCGLEDWKVREDVTRSFGDDQVCTHPGWSTVAAKANELGYAPFAERITPIGKSLTQHATGTLKSPTLPRPSAAAEYRCLSTTSSESPGWLPKSRPLRDGSVAAPRSGPPVTLKTSSLPRGSYTKSSMMSPAPIKL